MGLIFYSNDVWLYLNEKDSASNPSGMTQVYIYIHMYDVYVVRLLN